MRDIKFRGYAIDEMANSQWMNGYGVTQIEYVDGTIDTVILTEQGNYAVYEASIGQYTGINDYEGKEIYEGDIVEKEIMESIFDDSKLIGVVKMIDGCWCVVNDKKKVAKYLWSETDVNRVIGNVYENKNLLEEDNESRS